MSEIYEQNLFIWYDNVNMKGMVCKMVLRLAMMYLLETGTGKNTGGRAIGDRVEDTQWP